MAVRAAVALSLLAFCQAIVLEVQEHRAEQNATAHRAGNCDCLSWAEVYYKQQAFCGRGNELYFLSKYGFSAAYAATEPISGLPHKICYDFFKNFLDKSCVNVDLYPFSDNSKNGEQWCYVSNDCTDLNGGGFATNQQGFAQGAWHNLQTSTRQAWKKCAAGDNMLKTKGVLEVKAIGEYSDVSLSRIMRLAYPAASINWGEAAAFYEALGDALAAGTSVDQIVDQMDEPDARWGARLAEVHAELKSIVKSGQATVLDSPGHGDNFHVVQGAAVYSVTRNEWGDMAYLGGHFAQEFSVACVQSCAEPEKRMAVDLETM